MKKIPSLFKRDYEGTHQVYNEVVEGSEWVSLGDGVPTEKFDGTACMVRDGLLHKRYDRRVSKKHRRSQGRRRLNKQGEPWSLEDFAAAPDNWEACEESPDLHTGHWPGWVPVGDGPEDKYHRNAFFRGSFQDASYDLPDATYELVGPRVQGNPYSLGVHRLWRHGAAIRDNPRSFDSIREWLDDHPLVEGIVWHHPDGRMVKIKRRDFGFPWPPERRKEE